MSGQFPSDQNPPGIYRPPVNAPVPLPPVGAPAAPAVAADLAVASLPVFPPGFVPRPPAAPSPAPPAGSPQPLQVATYSAPPATPFDAPTAAAPPRAMAPAAAVTPVPRTAPLVAPAPSTPSSRPNIADRLKALPLTAKLGVAGASVVVLGVLYLGGGVLVANAEVNGQNEALRQSGTDLTKIDAFLSDVSVRDAEKLDAVAFKAALDAYGTRLTTTNATLTADQDRIDSTRNNIEGYGWLTPFESKQVHANDVTVNHASAALAPVVKSVAILRTEYNFYSIFVSADVHSNAAVAAAKKKDLPGATTEFQLARNDLSQAELLAKDADVGPQFAPVVAAYGRLMRDIAGFTSAAQSDDGVGAIQNLLQLDADSQAPVTFDQKAFRAWYSKKFDPLQIDFRNHAHNVPRYVVTRTQLV